MMLTEKEIEQRFGVSSNQLAVLEDEASRGELRGEPQGEISVGRPLLFGEEMKPVTFKEPESKIAAIEQRAKSLNMSKSDYLRWLVDTDLASVS